MSKAKDYGLRALKSLLLPVVVYLAFLIIGNGRFGSAASMIVIARQSVMPILISFALACNMSVGMWDFSAGAVVVIAAIVGGNLTKITGLGLPGLITACILTAVMLSAFTGFLYNVMKVPSMVLTIGLVLVYETVTFLIFKGNGALISGDITKLASSPYCFLVLAVMFGIFYLVFNYTPFGHNVRALGNGQLIAKNAGLSPAKTKFASFVFGGIFLGMAAVMLISMKGMVKATGSMATISTVFDAMMGIFIGLFLTKYCNLAFGVFIGAFTMKMLNAGLIAVGLSTTFRDITSGLFLLLILAISSNQGKITEFRSKKKRAAEANRAFESSLIS